MENTPAVREAHETINGETGEVTHPLVRFNNEFNIQPLLPTAGQLKITDDEKDILYKEVDEKDVEIRPDGLIYLPWMEYATRLNKAFGTEWSMIPQGMPSFKDNYILWGFWLIIRGHYSGYAIGEQQYYPNNYQMTWGDACEGAKSNALMRLCKGLGITLELWKPSFIRKWKKGNAESYQHYNKRKQKEETLWRRKGNKEEPPEDQPEPQKTPSGPPSKAKAAGSPKSASNDTGKTDKLDFSGRINCPEQIAGEGSPRSILKLTCKTCDKRNVCPMWQNTPPESQDGGQAATSPDDAGESTPKYDIPDKIPWTGKATMIVMLKELQEKEPIYFQSQTIPHEIDLDKLNALGSLNEEQAWNFYKDVLKAANEGGEFA